MNTYRLLPAAERDLESIWHYTEKNWGANQADCYIDGLIDLFELLSENPQMCRERHEFCPPVFIHHHAHHLVVFMVSSIGIDVIRILHESMDIDAHLD